MPFKDRVLGYQQLISGTDMNKWETQKVAVKGFFHRNAYWVMVPTLTFGLAILWGIWGIGGGQFFLDTLCKNDEKCEILFSAKYDFIHSYLIENNFQINKEKSNIVYTKYFPEVESPKIKVRVDVYVNNNIISICRIIESKNNDEDYKRTICDCYYVENIDELKYLCLKSNSLYVSPFQSD